MFANAIFSKDLLKEYPAETAALAVTAIAFAAELNLPLDKAILLLMTAGFASFKLVLEKSDFSTTAIIAEYTRMLEEVTAMTTVLLKNDIKA